MDELYIAWFFLIVRAKVRLGRVHAGNTVPHTLPRFMLCALCIVLDALSATGVNRVLMTIHVLLNPIKISATPQVPHHLKK